MIPADQITSQVSIPSCVIWPLTAWPRRTLFVMRLEMRLYACARNFFAWASILLQLHTSAKVVASSPSGTHLTGRTHRGPREYYPTHHRRHTSALAMPIRNPFARRPGASDNNAQTTDAPGFERVDTVGSGSRSTSVLSISTTRSHDTGEYKMSGA